MRSSFLGTNGRRRTKPTTMARRSSGGELKAPGTGGLTPARGPVPAWTDSERCVGKQSVFAAAAVLLRVDVVLHVW